jgi:hypothetical protein
MSLKRLLPLILLLTGLMAGPSCGAGAKVNASSGFTGVKVEASMLVQADAQTLWGTLTDYNKLATFIPDMVSSRIISPPGAPKKVEQVAEAGLFAFVMPDHVVLLMEESPNQLIRFRSVSGKVLSMNGEWRILGDAAPVTLVYRSHVVPMAPLPPLVSNYFVEDEVKKRFEAVGLEAERRMKGGGGTNRFNPWLYR